MTFSKALEQARLGKCIARLGWDNMCVFYTEGSQVPFLGLREETSHALKVVRGTRNNAVGLSITINPHLDLLCSDGSITCGWVPSQEDMKKDDWYVLREVK